MYKLGVVLYKHVLTNNLVSIRLLLNCHFWYCRSLYIINRYSLGISKIANFHTVFETRSYFYVKVVTSGTWGTLVINISKRSTLEKDLTVIFCVQWPVSKPPAMVFKIVLFHLLLKLKIGSYSSLKATDACIQVVHRTQSVEDVSMRQPELGVKMLSKSPHDSFPNQKHCNDQYRL